MANDTPKFDFQNMDVKLYRALKAMIDPWQAMSEQECMEGGLKYIPAEDDVLQAAQLAIAEFELHLGPLPEWAEGRNWDYSPVVGAQLCTRDGRRTGNGWIVRVGVELEHEYSLYECITDAGNRMVMTLQELENQFTYGDWICTPERIIRDFDRHGHFKTEPE